MLNIIKYGSMSTFSKPKQMKIVMLACIKRFVIIIVLNLVYQDINN